MQKNEDAKALRKYQAGVERALTLFDASHEWADYIAFLSRLLKSLQAPPANADVPLKSTIARCLGQCLRPSLPSGVHQKALEVYNLMFSTIDAEQLGKDLPLYLPGLSHTLSFASLSTRPQFLEIYDDYILALPAKVLRPAIRALIMSLLPGIEEETSEDFDITLKTFNRLREKFAEDEHEEIFWQNLFLASITSPNRRAGVLVYLVRYLPRLTSSALAPHENSKELPMQDVAKAIVNPEPGLLIRCFATGLQDPQPLVQRGFLDLLVSHLPLNADIFANDKHVGDLDILVYASTAIVLRRDMSLNRRLWTWYTGVDPKAQSNTQTADGEDGPLSPTLSKGASQSPKYFATYGCASLIRSIVSMIETQSLEASVRARPFRIALSLMDRWEVGGPTVESLFVPLMQSLSLYQATAPSQEAFDEVFRSANVFFDGVESRLVTSQMLVLIQKGDLDLILFIVANFNLDDEEMTRTHIPLMCVVVVGKIRRILNQSSDQGSNDSPNTVIQLSQILEDLLVMIPADAIRDQKGSDQLPADFDLEARIVQHYEKISSSPSGNTETSLPPSASVGSALLAAAFECFQECLAYSSVDGDFLGRILASIDQCLALVGGLQTLQRLDFLERLFQDIEASNLGHESRQYQVMIGLTRLIATLRSCDPLERFFKAENSCAFAPSLIKKLWFFLVSSKPQYHVEAVESIWLLHALSRPLRLAESTIISLLYDELGEPTSRESCMQRFATLWIHSRQASKQVQVLETEQSDASGDDVLDLLQHPLLQIIDAVGGNSIDDPCSTWIKSLASLNPLFGIVFQQMPKDQADSAGVSIILQRLSTLISIAKGNEAQWKAFCGKSGYRDAVFQLCSSLTSNQLVVNSLGVEALQIVHLLISNNGLELGDDMLKMLSTRLVASYDMEQFQDSLLETLQAAFSLGKPSSPPDYILPILLDGISSAAVDLNLDKWITLLCTIVPLLGTLSLFSNLLKITSCLCKRVESYFSGLQAKYTNEDNPTANGHEALYLHMINPERSISNLLSGMEYVLARAHHQASLSRTEKESGVNGSTVDLPSSRSSANDQLTVILCMQDALKLCARLWLWRSTTKAVSTTIDTKSLHYMTTRLRTRSRRILENLVEAEPQECLETLMGLWVEKKTQNSQHNQVLELLQTLDGARPKFMMPATFNAIYNRTNPGALDKSQKSSLSVNVNAIELIAFLNDYTNALEDDLLEEIWTDCTTFLKEVLSNPMPHRQILVKLLEFMAVLCKKMENTNFGEESRMRKELADLCARLFTAIFTIKPQGLDGSGSKSLDTTRAFDRRRSFSRSSVQAGNALQVLQETLPDLSLVLSQSDRLTVVYTGIATNISGPILHSRQYPQNVSADLLALLQTMSTTPAAIKTWRKDVLDAFNDVKFFQNQPQLVEPGWMPLTRQLVITDKSLMPELLTRMTSPAAAGLMFGVGATAARTEADKRTQLTLRRVALLLLSTETDYFVPNLQALKAKLTELLTATPESSPSSNSRCDVYLTLRTMLLAFSQSQLSSLWPLIDNELRDLCTSMVAKEFARFNLSAQLQGAKLLDLLLLMKPDEFQLHEWLFVTDTMDAIYPSHNQQPVALADQIILESPTPYSEIQQSSSDSLKKPWLCTDDSRDSEQSESLLAAFFAHLSIRTFESNYNLQRVDWKACRDDVIKDLFAE